MSHIPTHLEEEQARVADQSILDLPQEGRVLNQGELDAIGRQTITSESIAPTDDPGFQTTDTPATPDISGLGTDVSEDALGAEGQKQQSIIDRQIALNEALGDPETGVAAFRTEQREEQGTSALRTTEEDLVSQIKGFQIQAQRLANEKIQEVQRIQEESIGRGRTRAGIAPLTAAAQLRITREQASIASQALTASATLNAVQGKLVTAKRLVEEAVQAKFGAQIAELEANKANLDLLIDSPRATEEEKKRARKQKAKDDKELNKIQEEKESFQAVQDIGLEVASQVDAEGNKPSAVLLDRIQNAVDAEGNPDPIEAQRIASEAGFGAQPEQNTFTQRLDPQGNLIELELSPQGQVVNQRVISRVTPVGGVAGTPETAASTLLDIPSAGNVKSYLSTVFQDPDISAGARTNIGNVVNVASALEDFANANTEGKFAGLGGGAGLTGLIVRPLETAFGSEERKAERVENRQALEAINLKVQIWASGAALTDEQTKQVARLTPGIGDSDRKIKRKINGLYNFMMGQAESRLLVEGFNNPIPQIDLFEFGDLMSQASPEQLAELELELELQQ